jgi:exonuclease III
LQSFWATSRGKRGYSGVTTYCSTTWAPVSCQLDALKGIEEENEDEEKETPSSSSPFAGEGRIVETDFGPQAFILINVYVPNAGERPDRPRLATKLSFLKSLKAHCEALAAEGRRVLLVGDFNVCADERDVHPSIGLEKAYSEEERNLFLSFLTDQGGIFVDTWRHLHPSLPPFENSEKQEEKETDDEKSNKISTENATTSTTSRSNSGVYTVWDEKTSARAFNQGVRIDFVLATEDLVPCIRKCEVLGQDVLPPKWSDHAGILVEMEDGKVEEQDGGEVEKVEKVDKVEEVVLVPPEKHPPCPEWVELNRKFNDPSQKSILSMFGGVGVKRKEGKSEQKDAEKRQK